MQPASTLVSEELIGSTGPGVAEDWAVGFCRAVVEIAILGGVVLALSISVFIPRAVAYRA